MPTRSETDIDEDGEPAPSRGSIVQIVTEYHQWYGALVIVSEMKSFGCIGYVMMPTNGNNGCAPAWTQLSKADYKYVGEAEIVIQ